MKSISVTSEFFMNNKKFKHTDEYYNSLCDAMFSEFLINIKHTKHYKRDQWLVIDVLNKKMVIVNKKPVVFADNFYYMSKGKLKHSKHDEDLSINVWFHIKNDMIYTNDYLFFDILINLYMDYNNHIFIESILESLPFVVSFISYTHYSYEKLFI